jgi:hypothetical protein
MLRWNRHAVLLAGALSLAACGQATDGSSAKPAAAVADAVFPGLSADQVLAKTTAAATSATAVHLDGELTQEGKKLGFNLTLVMGKGSVGTVSIDGSKIGVRRVGLITYAQLSKEFLATQGPMGTSLGQLLGDKWLKADDSIAAAAGLGGLTGFDSPTAAIHQNIPKGAVLARVAGKDVDGAATTGLKFTSAKQSGTLYIAATGEPYPLLLESPTLGKISLSKWNKKVAVVAPKAKEVVDLGDLGLAGLG